MEINNKKAIIGIGLTLIVGIFLGWIFFGGSGNDSAKDNTEATHQENTIWTCSMHPQIRQSESGQCPICGMDLIPVETQSNSDDDPLEIKMSPTAMQLANVHTDFVKMSKPVKVLRLNGKVQPDERKVSSQTSHIAGRIEKLLVNYTGEYVQKGQVIAFIYSPELVTAQEELFEAYKIRDLQPALFKAAKDKLINWKLTDTQIDGILESGVPKEDFPILSDLNGIVTSKRVNLGDHISQGQSIYEVADLSSVWVLLDIYESDISWVKLGDEVEYEVQSFPGEKFKSKIAFIDPVINPQTRVAKARVNVLNKGTRLKPEMFVSATLESPLKGNDSAIIIPKSAVMWTGERSVVYVKTKQTTGLHFMMREVRLGQALGDSYLLIDGLTEGEEIAVNGTFSIDAAAQLSGRPSMMNPEGGPSMTGHNHGGAVPSSGNNNSHQYHIKSYTISDNAKNELTKLFDAYLNIKNWLVADDFESAIEASENMDEILKNIDMNLFQGEAHVIWMNLHEEINKASSIFNGSQNINEARNAFSDLSGKFIDLAKSFGPFEEVIYIQHCPMANDNEGANWLSLEEAIKNPYFGKSMMKCGSTTLEIK